MTTLLVTMATTGQAGDERRTATPQSERLARARWQPVRQADGRSAAPSPRATSAQVRRTQATEYIPTPRPMPGEPLPMEGEVILESAPMAGPYGYGEMMIDPAGCDAMVCGGSGCGGCGGTGCDAASFCDSGGCDSPYGGVFGRRDGCVTVCLPRDGWFSAEYLLWFQDGMRLPPLVTRSAAGTVPVLPTAQVLFGGDADYLDDSLDGVRLNFGIWLDRKHRWALQGDYFGLDSISENLSFGGGTGDPSIGRPFTDVSGAGTPAAVRVISQGNVATGDVAINLSSQLHSAGFQFRRLFNTVEGCGETIFCNVPQNYRSRLDGGIGYRYMELEEGLLISDDFTRTAAPTGTYISQDQFDTRTQFNGLDLGLYYERQRGCWSLNLRGRFGIGTNHQTVDIAGSTTSPTAAVGEGGLLAQESNIGSYDRDRISVLPELGATLGYQLTPRLRATVGYTFIYWSNVVRPGDQIDTDINGSLLAEDTGAEDDSSRPTFVFDETDYWVQGVSFGGDFRW